MMFLYFIQRKQWRGIKFWKYGAENNDSSLTRFVLVSIYNYGSIIADQVRSEAAKLGIAHGLNYV
jgi:hypothetical protein